MIKKKRGFVFKKFEIAQRLWASPKTSTVFCVPLNYCFLRAVTLNRQRCHKLVKDKEANPKVGVQHANCLRNYILIGEVNLTNGKEGRPTPLRPSRRSGCKNY